MQNDVSSLEVWVGSAPDEQLEFRQAVYLILSAITSDLDLRETMVMKGGLLMAIRYQSTRYTKDIDFSTSQTRADLNVEKFIEKLEASLAVVVAESEFDLDCRVQSWKIKPAKDDATFPSVILSMGYAYKGTPKHKRLLAQQSPTTISIDFSLNELIFGIEDLAVGDVGQIQAYNFSDLVAEKIRSLLQQEVRNRYRRQDTYDLRLLIERGIDDAERGHIYVSLMQKARSRNIEPTIDSLSNPELKRRAKADYATLADEVSGALPDFDESFDILEAFYRSLPWEG